MISCASVAIAAAALAPQKARAQVAPPPGAFRGNVTATTGTVTRTDLTNTTETIVVGSGTATIDWQPNTINETSGNYDFLPQGNVATFTNDALLTSDFTVLNRILPIDGTTPIELNGKVISQLQSGAGTATGGNVWFYSPGGILVGATAAFDVGGLLLTTNVVDSLDPSSGGFVATFSNPNATNSAVEISPNAKINATAANSYVAIVAPKIVQGGDIRVDGSAAYVAAQGATLTMSDGLFNIQVSVGTDDSNGVVHTGSTTGPASGAADDYQRMYMVAVPKNQALTMLLSGSIGYDATTASFENGQIVLSSGYSINGSTSGHIPSATSGPQDSGFTIGGDAGGASITSDLWGIASGEIAAIASAGGLNFDGNVEFVNQNAPIDGDIRIGATNGFSIFANGTVQAFTTGSAALDGGIIDIFATNGGVVDFDRTVQLISSVAADGSGTAGTVSLYADNGSIDIAGAADLNAGVGAASPPVEGFSQSNTAGDVTVTAINNGTIVTHSLNLSAIANGQDNQGNGDGSAGSGTGGTIGMFADTGGVITVNGNLTASADGIGGNMRDGGTTGGAGFGGTVYVTTGGGDVSITGSVLLSALGLGGDYIGEGTPSVATGGLGDGGQVSFYTTGSGGISAAGSVELRADGSGGDGRTGGEGYGGSAGVSGFDGSIGIGGAINITATGTGGDASSGFGGNGGYGSGGSAYIEALAQPAGVNPATAATITGGNATVNASGYGGSGGAGDGIDNLAGNGGDGQGGYFFDDGVEIRIVNGAYAAADNDGASLLLGDVALTSAGYGGAGGAGGAGQSGGLGGSGYGGLTQAGNYDLNGTGTSTATATFGNVTMDAGATGGSGGAGDSLSASADGNGGQAVAGGSVSCFDTFTCGGAVFNAKGTVTTGNVALNAVAWGGAGAVGGNATGGRAALESYAGSAFSAIGNVDVNASALAGAGDIFGGNALGGTAIVHADGANPQIPTETASTFDVTGQLYLDAGAVGGSSGSTGAGGNALGGIASLTAFEGTDVNLGSLLVYANSTGGTGGVGGNAGNGDSVNGTAELNVFGNVTVAGGLEIRAFATSGDGGSAGTAWGGDALLSVDTA
ncbi:MAG TPA: hypothetical protein VFP57_05600, partial [Sphingomicrobium sp.]|nr:hypothetical protein [Sphingomicrobium sp.]